MKTYTLSKKFAFAVIWIGIWWILSLIVGSSLILPGPIDTVIALVGFVQRKAFYLDILWTVLRWLVSVIVAFIMGSQLAWLSYRHKWAEDFLSLPVTFLKSIPVMAIILYIILLVKSDFVAIIVCFLMCFPIVYTNILSYLKEVPKDLIEVASLNDLNVSDKQRLLFIPATYGGISSALSLSTGMAWKVVIASEILSIPKYSLGYEMLNSKYYLNTAELFGYIVVIIILSKLSELLVSLLTNRLKAQDYRKSKIHITKEASSEDASVQIENLSKTYDDKPVIKDFSLDLESNSHVSIMGPSGIGKTTIVRIICGLENPTGGNVIIKGNLSVAFQEPRLYPWLNVYDNLALSGKSQNCDIVEMANLLELDDSLYVLPEKLSGGMKSRVSLGRALLKSGILILDEPLTGLDTDLKNRIIEKLKPIFKDRTVLIITHDDEIAKLSDRIITI